MTQPIQEPSTPRSISKLTWGENQLFRRPAPAGSDNRPWARLGKPFPDGTFYPNQTIGNNTNTVVDWDTTYNMDPGDSGETYFSTIGAPVTALRFEVTGVYAMTAEVFWSEAANFPWFMYFAGSHDDWNHVTPGYYDSFGSADAAGVITMTHRWEAGDSQGLGVYQRSGGNRTINAAYFEAVYLGSWTGISLDDILPMQ